MNNHGNHGVDVDVADRGTVIPMIRVILVMTIIMTLLLAW